MLCTHSSIEVFCWQGVCYYQIFVMQNQICHLSFTSDHNTNFLNTGIFRSTHAVAVASASTTRQNAASSKINTACPAATDCTPHCSNTVKGVIFTNLYNRFTYTGCTRYTAVSYTHLDVYKRQLHSCSGNRYEVAPSGRILGGYADFAGECG